MANFYDLPPEVVLKNTKTKKSMLTALQQQLIATITYSLTKTLKNISKNQKILHLKRKWEKFEKSQQEEDVQTDMFEIIKKPAKVSKRGKRGNGQIY